MSTVTRLSNRRCSCDDERCARCSRREQILGQLLVIVIALLAIVLQAL